MSRLDLFRPCGFARRARPRVRLLRARGGAGLGLLAALVLGGGAARADEFSPVAAGDPIYRQLRALSPGQNSDAGLTRYEAALQSARVITRVANDPRADLSRAGWRAVRDLTQSLGAELRQLGIDIEATRALADRNLQAPPKIAAVPGLGVGSQASPNPRAGAVARGPISSGLGLRGGAGASASFRSANLLLPGLQSGNFSASIMPRLRVGAALVALQRAQNDPFNGAGADQALLSANQGRLLRSDVAVDYDVNSWLSVSAQRSQRALNVPGVLPPLEGDFYSGASEANSAGGGLSVALGLLNFRTDIESLSTNTGARGTSVGGGVKLSAWQNRLSLSAHLARLQPEDRAYLQQTKTELGVGLEVTNRLNLSLLYQGLFTQRNDGTERVVGGLNLSF